ncbi:hypothetical protein E2F50_14270 [Rhizobium deserti]|uniref:YCII-related domain-containing protein n=1 Tax=Rhizobium deserti TaxID=2547961 RepID=A0A4R5UHQ2_9HYPH|nr:hypothetical protein [Rhizobium deserti]TDK35407.1 hypothetical protein E2F50_14270 [Rhizobium deserti]
MHLVQILLPVSDKSGKAFPPEHYAAIRDQLTHLFGGMTFHRTAPAEGLWISEGEVARDTIVTAEVMIEELDRAWWAGYRAELESLFRQDEIVIRAWPISRL